MDLKILFKKIPIPKKDNSNYPILKLKIKNLFKNDKYLLMKKIYEKFFLEWKDFLTHIFIDYLMNNYFYTRIVSTNNLEKNFFLLLFYGFTFHFNILMKLFMIKTFMINCNKKQSKNYVNFLFLL